MRKWERARTRNAIDLQQRIDACPCYPRGEVRYLWEANDEPIDWQVAGYYWRTEPAAAWALLGVDVVQARRYVRRMEIQQGVRSGPPTAGEFLEGLGVVASAVGILLPAATDAVEFGKAMGGKR